MKKARRLLKWVKGNMRWLLAALAALGIVVGGWVERGKYEAKMEAQAATQAEAIKNKDKRIKELQRSSTDSKKDSVVIERFDPVTGKLLERLTAQHEELKQEHQKLLDEITKTPKVTLPGQKDEGLYPLGVFVMSTLEGELGGGASWRIVPRLALPLVPDASLAVCAGYHRDAIIGLLLVEFHH